MSLKSIECRFCVYGMGLQAAIAQLGERQTEDLKVPGSIPGRGTRFSLYAHITQFDILFRECPTLHVEFPQFPQSFITWNNLNFSRCIELTPSKKSLSEGGFEPPPTYVDQNTPVKERLQILSLAP